MKRLAISLIVLVLFSILGLTWVLSELSYRFDSANSKNSSIRPYLEISEHIKTDFLKSNDHSKFLSRWLESSILDLQIQNKSDFPLQALIDNGWTVEEPLVLEARGELSIHYLMHGSEHVLSVFWPYVPERSASFYPALLTIVFYFGVLLVIALWLYPLILRLNHLGETARSFGQGQLNLRLKQSRFRYIDEIEREFNAMADRIEQLIEDNRLLSRAVSHDLKTPIARLRFGLDVLAECKTEQQREEYLVRIDKDLDEMEELVNTLLQYASLEQNSVNIQRSRIDLAQFSMAIVRMFSEDEKLSGINLRSELSKKSTEIWADKKYLQMLIKNLLVNAYNFANREVVVSIVHQKEWIMLTVEDDGPGFDEGEVSALLKPFSKGVNVGRKTGHGMGLAIVQRVAQWMEGQVYLERSEQLGGAKVRVVFPQVNHAN